MRKTKAVFTLNIDGHYAPEITDLTYPLIASYAKRIGAELIQITDRKFHEWPVVYEKLQIHELGREFEWSIYFDSDCVVHPDLFDLTEMIPRDTVVQNSKDLAGNRFTYDEYFRRDGRNIGACNWFTVASRWCLDLWRPLDDLTPVNAFGRIHPITIERKSEIPPDHLIDDFVLSRNISRFGLKHLTFRKLLEDLGRNADEYFWHIYTLSNEAKVPAIKEVIQRWGI